MSPALSVYLDLLRLIAAMMVLALHLNEPDITGNMVWRIAHHGTEGVVFFFVLSGFVISQVAASREQTVRSYVVARAARIYSVAVLAIPLTLIADAIGLRLMPGLYLHQNFYNPNTGFLDILQSLTFVDELWFNHVIIGSNEPFWSLGFEVVYYAIFGAFMLVRGRMRYLWAALLLLIAGPKLAAYFLIWLLGYAAHRAVTRPRGLSAPLGAALWLASLVAYFVLHDHKPDVFGVFYGRFFTPDALTARTWAYYFVVGVIVALNLVGFAAISPALAGLARRVGPAIRWSAGASFTLYLIHQPVLLALAAISPWPIGSLARLVFITVAVLAIILLAAELGERRKRLWHGWISRLIPRGI